MSEIPPQNQWQQDPGYSNYPRPTDPYTRPPGVHFDNFGKAWSLFQSNMGTWVLSVLVVGILGAMISVPSSLGINYLLYGTIFPMTGFQDPRYYLSLFLQLIPGGVVGIFTGSVLYMGVKQARGQQVDIADIFAGFSYAGPLFLATILQTLITYTGFAFLLVPGIFLTGALGFTQLLVIDQKLSAIDAITTSFNVLKRDAWMMFLLILVAIIISALGVCLCFVGALFTAPIYYLTIGLTYNGYFPGIQIPDYPTQPIGIEPPR